ncbi:hypothetical protein C2G38_2184255 [Gigaspora rosea]|uniref:Uncharacterized protein n=1 Tax=Gigaspora rosea TaxID=44941 RepID=A0A397V7Z5_9GLOM|nr:hypothetical protein C2G38_2184255 [Gigaspora rosea]
MTTKLVKANDKMTLTTLINALDEFNDPNKKVGSVNQDININDLLKNLSIEDKSLEIEELKKNIQDKSLEIEELKNKNKDMMLKIKDLKTNAEKLIKFIENCKSNNS